MTPDSRSQQLLHLGPEVSFVAAQGWTTGQVPVLPDFRSLPGDDQNVAREEFLDSVEQGVGAVDTVAQAREAVSCAGCELLGYVLLCGCQDVHCENPRLFDGFQAGRVLVDADEQHARLQREG